MSPADALFSCCRLVWISQTNVPVALLDPGINGTASLPDENLTIFAGYAVHAWSFQSQVVFHGPKEIRNFPGRKANRLDVVPGRHTADGIESRINKGKKRDRCGLFRGGSDSFGGSRARRICQSR
jgi:hypothetical protein